MSIIEFSFLGPTQIRIGTEYAELSSAKSIALLGYLASQRQPQTRESIMALLWPDSLPQAARKNLRNLLWNVHKSLGQDIVETDRDWLKLSDDVWVDVRAFLDVLPKKSEPDISEVEAAVTLYRGPFLDGSSLVNVPEFELWLVAERERLSQHYLALLDFVIAGHEHARNWAQVVEVARLALTHDRYQEHIQRSLMNAHVKLGERQKAIRQYELLKELLHRDLGVEPMDETRGLHQEILEGNSSRTDRQPRPDLSREVSVFSRSGGEERLSSKLPFVGRSIEIEALDLEWERVKQGTARIILLAGELGIGKTCLWQEWSSRLSKDTVLLNSRCLDTTQDQPLAPIITLIRQQPCAKHILNSPSRISGIWLAELSRLMPEIRQNRPDIPAPISLQPAEERLRLFESLTQVMLAASEKPFVLFIDDLHWVDPTTLDWLVYLAERMRDESFLLVTAFRPDEAPSQVTYALANWQRQNIALRLALAPFTLHETTELLHGLGLDVDRAIELQEQSAGNPYIVLELSQSEPGKTPPTLGQLLLARLEKLGMNERSLLQAASIQHGDLDFEVLRSTSGLSEEAILDSLDKLLEANVLVENNDRYAFAQPLVSDMVRGNLSIARRRYLHRRAAVALEKIHGSQLTPYAAELSIHYAESGNPKQAAGYAEMAAKRAISLAAPGEAIAFFRQAILWDPSFMRLMGLGEALTASGDFAGAQDLFLEAFENYEREGETAAAASTCLTLANNYMLTGQREKVIQWAGKALGQYIDELEPEHIALGHFLMGAGLLGSSLKLAEAESHLLKARRIAADHGLSSLALQSQFEQGNLLARRGDVQQAVEVFASVAEEATVNHEPLQETLAYNNLAYHEYLVGRLPEAERHINRALALAESYRFALIQQFLYSTRGQVAMAKGDSGEAETWFDRSLEEAEKMGNRVQVANIQAHQGLLARDQDNLDEALLYLQEAIHLITAENEPFMEFQIELWLADLHRRRGEYAAAEELLTEVLRRLSKSDFFGLQKNATELQKALNKGRKTLNQ